MKQNRNEESGGPENDTARRFHIEDSPATRGDSSTSGQVGPKSKRRFSAANGPPVPDMPDASPPVREDSGMSGIGQSRSQNSGFPRLKGHPFPTRRMPRRLKRVVPPLRAGANIARTVNRPDSPTAYIVRKNRRPAGMEAPPPVVGLLRIKKRRGTADVLKNPSFELKRPVRSWTPPVRKRRRRNRQSPIRQKRPSKRRRRARGITPIRKSMR